MQLCGWYYTLYMWSIIILPYASISKRCQFAVDWFAYNDMKLNPDKCRILTSGFKHEVMITNIGNALVIEAQEVRLLGIDIHTKLSFSGHIESICKKAGKKLNALSRQCTILPLNKRKILMSAYFISQFSYCPLVWMFCSRGLNNKIIILHYRALQIVYRDFTSTFQQQLLFTIAIFASLPLKCARFRMVLPRHLCLKYLDIKTVQ